MDQDDPERRIAELERQRAEARAVGDPAANQYKLTAEQVHNVAFSKPPLGQRGYHEDEVDAFLERVEAALRDPTARGGVTPVDLHNVAFSKPPVGHRGYNEDEVDAFLDLVKNELTRRLPGQGGRQYFVAPAGVVPQSTFPGEPGFGRQAESRHQPWRLEGNTVKVIDRAGVRWSVHRRWGVRYWNALIGDAYEDDAYEGLETKLFDLLINVVQLIVLWPPWFIGKCLGVRFKIVIVRNGDEVGDVRVRGFRESRRRLQEIAEMAAAGTLQQKIDADSRPKTVM